MSDVQQDLVLHVGLPKTGTTSLQREVFPGFTGYVCGTESSAHSGDLARQMLGLYQVKGAHRDLTTNDWRADATDWWMQARNVSSRPLLVSLEGLFRWFDPVTGMPWPLMGEGTERWSTREAPHPLISFIRALQVSLPACRVRVVLTSRNQPEFMASHYAQISYRLLTPSQGDFEEKVRQVIRRVDPFFDWSTTALGLVKLVGLENFQLTVFEEGLDQVARDIANFVDDSWHPPSVTAHHNVREGATGWSTTTNRNSQLRGWARSLWPKERLPRIRKAISTTATPVVRFAGGTARSPLSPIRIGPELREEILKAYQESNYRLSKLSGRDLWKFGYHGPGQQENDRNCVEQDQPQ